MDVDAVVVAGAGSLALVAGESMVVRSVRAVLASGVADRVLIDCGDQAGVLAACAGLPVAAWEPRRASSRFRGHGGQRRGVAGGDDRCTRGILVVHDAARPLAPPALFRAVVAAMAAGYEMVVPVLPLSDTVKLVDADGLVLGTPDRSGLRVVQTPYALRMDVWDGGSALLAQPAALAAQTIPGDPLAFPVRSEWDRELAELLVTR